MELSDWLWHCHLAMGFLAERNSSRYSTHCSDLSLHLHDTSGHSQVVGQGNRFLPSRQQVLPKNRLDRCQCLHFPELLCRNSALLPGALAKPIPSDPVLGRSGSRGGLGSELVFLQSCLHLHYSASGTPRFDQPR